MTDTHPAFSSRGAARRQRWPRTLVVSSLVLIAGIGLGLVIASLRLVYAALAAHSGQPSAAFSLSMNNAPSTDWSQFHAPGDGRVNILLLGIGGVNDAGEAHDGTLLTDSIELLSIDPIHHTASLTSVPRDFMVPTPGGQSYEKINAVYEGVTGRASDEGSAVKTTVGRILGTSVTNYVLVDFTAVQKLVDDVGGIDLNVPTALTDPEFPCDDQISFCPFSISPGPHHFTGALALKYMRSRHVDTDFGRSKRQQAVAVALEQKLLTLGVLANPVKLTQLLTDLGQHVKTDLTVGELTQFATLARQVQSASITSNVLDTSSSLGLLVAEQNDLGDVEIPAAGTTNYHALQRWFQKNNPDPLIAKEGAAMTVANAGVTSTAFSTFLDDLVADGFIVTSSSSASATTPVTETTIRTRSRTTAPVSLQYLEQLTGGRIVDDASLPAGVDISVDYAGVTPKQPTASAIMNTPSTSAALTHGE